MFEYNSTTINPTSDITIDILNQMVLNDAANEQMRLLALEPPLAYVLMDNNTGSPSAAPSPDTTNKALYFAKNTTTGVTLNIDNVINSPLSIDISVDRAGIYRFYVVALVSSGAGDCVPSFQITDIDTNIVQEVGGYITTGTQSSTTGHYYTPSILFVDRWLYAGKTYKFTVTTGLLGTNSDIAYINAYKFPPTIAYLWVQGYNGSGQQIEIPNFSIPSFGIDIPNFEIPNFIIDVPTFDIPDISIPDFNFDFGDFGGLDGFGDFNSDFPFGIETPILETGFANLDDYTLFEGSAYSNESGPNKYHTCTNLAVAGGNVIQNYTFTVDAGSPGVPLVQVGGDGFFGIDFDGALAVTTNPAFTRANVNNSWVEYTVGSTPSYGNYIFQVMLCAMPTAADNGFGCDTVLDGFLSKLASAVIWCGDNIIGDPSIWIGDIGTITDFSSLPANIVAGDIIRLEIKSSYLKIKVNGHAYVSYHIGTISSSFNTLMHVGFKMSQWDVESYVTLGALNPTEYHPGDMSFSDVKWGLGRAWNAPPQL